MDAIIKSNLTIKLRSLSIGDGTMGNAAASTSAVITQYIQQNQDILQVYVPNQINLKLITNSLGPKISSMSLSRAIKDAALMAFSPR